MQDSIGAVRWAVRPPAELLALIDPCRDPDAPVGMQELRSAQAALQTHLQGTLQPALMQMSGSDSAASSDLLLSGLAQASDLRSAGGSREAAWSGLKKEQGGGLSWLGGSQLYYKRRERLAKSEGEGGPDLSSLVGGPVPRPPA